MANNPVSGVATGGYASPITSTSAASQPARPQKSTNTVANPQDTVTISSQARAAQQTAQSGQQQTGGDSDHDGH
jgi:hypothetical protein